MYTSSSSWGKFAKQDKNDPIYQYAEKYLKDVDFEPYDENNMAFALESIFNEKIKPKTTIDYMKDIWEGLRMPVLNPKTGEQDYVDISLVSKIVVDPEYVEDMASNNKIKVDITLEGNQDTNEVYVISQNEVFGKHGEIVSLSAFEEMLFKAINEAKDQRLEAVEEFNAIINRLVTKFVDENRSHQKHLARLGHEYDLTQGIGIIRDTKTNQDVGTFESFSYLYDRNKRNITFNGILLSGRTMEDLSEKDRFEMAFYSIEHGTIYSVISKSELKINGEEVLHMSNFSLVTEAFDDTHVLYQTAVEANNYKSFIADIDSSHPLYSVRMEEFKNSRLSILEESKQKQKQEKLVNQFADIDIF